MVLLEAIVVGTFASVLGIFAGLAIAGALQAGLAAFGVDTTADNGAATNGADVVVLAVKPQVLGAVVRAHGARVFVLVAHTATRQLRQPLPVHHWTAPVLALTLWECPARKYHFSPRNM